MDICIWQHVCHWSDALTAVEVDEKHPFEMLVVDEGRMHARARLMVDGEVTDVWVPPKQIILLFVNDQFLQREHFSRPFAVDKTTLTTHTIRYKWLGLGSVTVHVNKLTIIIVSSGWRPVNGK